ncbi:MAG: hypothetical protein NDJ75_09495 [Thermoanaerobaculia bacterium]|nr:hypothetical protein [Thermoanaerobaculia bacterium]
MRFDSLFRILFVVYCLEAGVFLTLAPWTAAWQQLATLVPVGGARVLLSQPWLRGLVSGFGMVHLVWAVHDIDLVLRRSPPHARDSAPARRQ